MTRQPIGMLTNSRLKARRRCPRYHQLKYDCGLESFYRAEPLIFGDLIHKALEPWWLWWMLHDDGAGALAAALAGLNAVPDVDAFLFAKARAMIEGYHAYYEPEMHAGTWDVLGVEYEFVAPLVDPATGARSRRWVKGGKLDVLATYLPTKTRRLIEHKSSSEDLTVGSVYWKRLRMDTQVSQYFDGAEAIGSPVEECTYDVLRKPDQKRLRATAEEDRQYTKEKSKKCAPCKGTGDGCTECGGAGKIVTEAPRLYSNQRAHDETPDEYYQRCKAAIAEQPAAFFRREEIPRLKREIEQNRLDAWETAAAIDRDRERGYAARNPDACEQYGRTCEMFPICSGSGSASDDRLYQIRKSVHPELDFFEAPVLGPDGNATPNDQEDPQ